MSWTSSLNSEIQKWRRKSRNLLCNIVSKRVNITSSALGYQILVICIMEYCGMYMHYFFFQFKLTFQYFLKREPWIIYILDPNQRDIHGIDILNKKILIWKASFIASIMLSRNRKLLLTMYSFSRRMMLNLSSKIFWTNRI